MSYLKNGGTLPGLKTLLCHSSFQTTLKYYLHDDPAEILAIQEKMGGNAEKEAKRKSLEEKLEQFMTQMQKDLAELNDDK